MAGRSSSSQPTQTTQRVVQSQELPAYARPYYEELLGATSAEFLKERQPYTGARVAEFTPTELEAMQGIKAFGRAGLPAEFQQAGDILRQQAGMQMPQYTAGYQAGDLRLQERPYDYQVGYQASPFDVGYVPQERQAGYTAGALAPTSGPLTYEENIQRFMSPYQQMVTDVEKREARRASQQMGAEIGQQAAMAGGLGGYREAIMQSERERNLGQQLADIQARGSQQAYESAVQQLGAERASQLQQEQLGLQRFGALEQARQSQEQMQQQAFQFGEQARQQAAQMGLSAQEASDAARRAQEEFMQRVAEQSQSAFQASQQLGLSGFEAQERARQAQEQARLSGAQLGLSQQELASRAALDAAGQLTGLGGLMSQEQLNRLQTLGGIGEIERGRQQQLMDVAYQDYLEGESYMPNRLGMFSNILQGLPTGATTSQQTYAPSPSALSQALGSGISALGLYRALS